ncbi:WecB/TagA/CpsF family glycosyltransferase [Terriglobus roseus]|nr:WecB/TagA/CpsF family glycosyltransferase [Terriglobus roseus]
MVMEAWDNPGFRTSMNSADLVNPDGMPIVWGLRALGHRKAARVYGPDATVVLLEAARDEHVPIAFYGGREDTLQTLVKVVEERFQGIDVRCAISPPFRALSPEEDTEVVRKLAESGARMLFIGLGCPKQEQWIFDHRGKFQMVLLAVGAAFDFLAGTKPQAPRWMMRSGLEWVFRLASEPRRLAHRYLKHNPRFMVFFLLQWMRSRRPTERLIRAAAMAEELQRSVSYPFCPSSSIALQAPVQRQESLPEKKDLYAI